MNAADARLDKLIRTMAFLFLFIYFFAVSLLEVLKKQKVELLGFI